MNLGELEEYADVLTVVEFGSAARGDDDEHSDIDLFIMCRDMPAENIIELRNKCVRPGIGSAMNVSAYKQADVLEMAGSGSLFLWHLKLEGRVVFSKGGIFQNIVAKLRAYNGYEKNFKLYLQILGDVKESFDRRRTLNEFDYALLFTLARNTCMQLCMRHGSPEFGRKSVYIRAKEICGGALLMDEALYDHLFGWKTWYERGVCVRGWDSTSYTCGSIIKGVERLVRFGASQCL
jgi:hypothetical protein